MDVTPFLQFYSRAITQITNQVSGWLICQISGVALPNEKEDICTFKMNILVHIVHLPHPLFINSVVEGTCPDLTLQ